MMRATTPMQMAFGKHQQDNTSTAMEAQPLVVQQDMGPEPEPETHESPEWGSPSTPHQATPPLKRMGGRVGGAASELGSPAPVMPVSSPERSGLPRESSDAAGCAGQQQWSIDRTASVAGIRESQQIFGWLAGAAG